MKLKSVWLYYALYSFVPRPTFYPYVLHSYTTDVLRVAVRFPLAFGLGGGDDAGVRVPLPCASLPRLRGDGMRPEKPPTNPS